jgi:hypothetical protein
VTYRTSAGFVLIAAVCMLAPISSTSAGMILNGDFELPGTPPETFDDWSTTYGFAIAQRLHRLLLSLMNSPIKVSRFLCSINKFQ